MSMSIVLSALLAAAPAAPMPCKPIAGWEEVMARKQVRWIVLGEVHGNNETPDLFADAVCLTARSRKIVVALEQSSLDQGAIDLFISSDGGKDSKQAFSTASMWNGAIKDGRSSEANFRLFDTLRQMRSAGQIEAVVAFVPSHFTTRPIPGDYEKGMAGILRAAARPGTTVMALVGNVHALRTKVAWQGGYMPMAAHLPAEELVTLDALGDGGATWTCQGEPMVCGPRSNPPSAKACMAGVELASDDEAAYSGVIHLGATTASPPQQGQAAKSK